MPGATPIYGLPYPSLDDPPNGPALGEDLALAVETELDGLADDVTALRAPGWTTYTPTWTASTTNPSIGNGTLAGRYRRPTGADLILVQILLTAGSTTNFGAGFWRFSLPVTASTAVAGSTAATGPVLLVDNSGGEAGYRTAVAWLQSATTVGVVSSTGGLGATDPFAWAVNDQVRLTYQYQPV